MTASMNYIGTGTFDPQGAVTAYYGITVNDLFVITFSDGTQIAISNYSDNEASDAIIGIPVSGGSVDTFNFYMWEVGVGATFSIYEYDGLAIQGSPIYTFSAVVGSAGAFQLEFDVTTKSLEILFDDVVGSNGTNTAYNFYNTDGTYDAFDGNPVHTSVVCYLQGTRILTERGEVPVEELRRGDRVETRFGGLRVVEWIGIQRFSGHFASAQNAPVCIKAGALRINQPHRDLYVSPAHAVLIDGHLVAASLLVNDVTITQTMNVGEIVYYHLDLGAHDCVLAEGAWAESYAEHLNRDSFLNSSAYREANLGFVPRRQEFCLPYINGGDDLRLPALRVQVTPTLDDAQLTDDPDVHMLANGKRVHADQIDQRTWRFYIPARTRSLRLVSRSARPSMLSESADHRKLGLCLGSFLVGTGGAQSKIALDHPGLARGFHDPEHDGAKQWRWTDGNAAIPMGIIRSDGQPVILTLIADHLPKMFIGAD